MSENGLLKERVDVSEAVSDEFLPEDR